MNVGHSQELPGVSLRVVSENYRRPGVGAVSSVRASMNGDPEEEGTLLISSEIK
jgi:hypothetical protein